MNTKKIAAKALQIIRAAIYRPLDSLYLYLDRKHIRRTRNIRLIPNEPMRRGGKYAYSEWAHVIGIFQTLIYLNLEKKQDNTILDIGCGTGLLGIASQSFLGQHGKYVGIDVIEKDIEYCRKHYPSPHYEFVHFDVNNPTYAPAQKETNTQWPVSSDTIDLVTALSVWTHLSEADATFYFEEIGRVLKPGGKAIISFFVLDEEYKSSLGVRSEQEGRFHTSSQALWVFDQPSYGSDEWYHPAWVKDPEAAIGVTQAGLDRLCAASGMKIVCHHQGNWKEIPGVYFQDVLVLQKPE